MRLMQKEFFGKQSLYKLDTKAVRVSCGWPSTAALARTKRRIGECWSNLSSTDGKTFNIFVSPSLQDNASVLETLAHELCHVVAGPGEGHKRGFQLVAAAIGFMPPWKSTPASPPLSAKLATMATKLKDFPHYAIDKSTKKKQTTRMIKIVCPACGYTCRTTATWLAQGLPMCMNCEQAFEVVSV